MDFGWCWLSSLKSSRKDMKSVMPEGNQWIKYFILHQQKNKLN